MTREDFDEYVADRYETMGRRIANRDRDNRTLPKTRKDVTDEVIQCLYRHAHMQWNGSEHDYVKALCRAHNRHATTVFDFARASFVSGYIGVIEHRW